MKFLDNLTVTLGTSLALTAGALAAPTVLSGVTAEQFQKLGKIEVRADGTVINSTSSSSNITLSNADSTGIEPISDMVCPETCDVRYTYTLNGTGNPHQNFVITQKGGSLVSCDNSNTGTSTGYSVTIGWTFSATFNLDSFASLGFSVTESETTTTTQSFDCNGVAAEGGDICVLFYQAVTAYTVNVEETSQCSCGGLTEKRTVGTAVIYAPNSGQVGSIPARGINVVQHGVEQCVGDDDRTINYYCGPAGGPEWWSGRGDGPWIEDYVNNREPAGCAIPIEANRYTD